LLQNVKRACFTALNASINNVFKVSSDPVLWFWAWHTEMSVWEILDQLCTIYGLPMPATLENRDSVFCGQYLGPIFGRQRH
jgi:hypothetical protein